MSRDARLVELRRADAAARVAAQREFASPMVLEAGAGTGKTAALVARAVTWCLGPGWESAASAASALQPAAGTDEATAARVLEGVVAITFTDAAAAEMAERLAEALARLAVGDVPVGVAEAELTVTGPERARRARALLVALDRLQVGTIHAYCRRLLARFPLEAGVHPAFTVDADGSLREAVARDVVEAGMREALAGEPDAGLVALAAAGIGPAGLAAALVELLAEAVEPEALAADPFTPEVAGGLRDALLAALRDFEEAGAGALTSVKGANAVAPRAIAALRALADTAAVTPADVAGLDMLCAAAGDGERLDAGARLAKWGRGEPTGAEANALGESAAAVCAAAGRLATALGHLRSLQPVLYGHARTALSGLLAEAHRELTRRGVVGFQALLRDARNLLCSHDGIAARLRSEMRQLLVDEFQDTDPAQCDVLRVLALDGEVRPGLFLVGDPKQSIYGWREADLESYERFVRGLESTGRTRQRLSVSFRSAPPILEEVERRLAPVMLEDPGVQPPFQPLVPCVEKERAEGFRRDPWAPIEYWVCWDAAPGGDGKSPRTVNAVGEEIEADWLARDLRALHDRSGVAWSEVGVLLRSFGNVETVLRALREAGVPYAVERDRSYYRRREVIEAAALVQTILDPGDHLALVTWLRSAQAGVPDAALLDLWLGGLPGLLTELAGPDPVRLERVRALARGVAAGLPTEEIPGLDGVRGWEEGLAAAVSRLAGLRAAFRHDSAAAFVERVRVESLIEATEAARFLGAWRLANLDRFFRQLEQSLEAAGGDVTEVLRALRLAIAEEREAEEATPREAAADAVRVMTIHKAKGLDFSHVYLLQAHKQPGKGHDRPNQVARMPGGAVELRLLGAPSPGWVAVEERRRRVEAAERVRTLYVAMTRAKERLVVSGSWPQGGRNAAGSHLELLLRSWDGEAPEAIHRRLVEAGGWDAVIDGARWVFPSLAPKTAAVAARDDEVALPEPDEIERQAGRLARLREEAGTRMARRYGGPASAEAHRLLRERHEEDEPRSRRRDVERDGAAGAATAAGSLVHGVLERLELGGDPAAALGRARRGLEALVDPRPAENVRAVAVARAGETLDRFRASRLWDAFSAIAPHVVARELPVLLLPDEDVGPVGFVAGTIDLLYRDPATDRLVVADYKTDEVAGAALEERALSYASQGQAYVRAVQEALALPNPPRFELWFLHAGIVKQG
ncbi:MAG: UvrD-helicase domain-containing protein [Acidobacteria bacterium]|nr:UvrD-helicase domain-containing protein [Acidobacteriota bacterium]